MRIFCIIIISLGLLHCKSANTTDNISDCVENNEFRNEFFDNINYIDKNISIKQDEKFRNSLRFLSEYVHVSFNKMVNYANTYPIDVYEEDRKKWIKWYEENKCHNIEYP